MKKRYRLIRRGNRSKSYYCVDNQTGKRTSLGKITRDEAQEILQAKNTAERQPLLNLQIASRHPLVMRASVSSPITISLLNNSWPRQELSIT